jgi:hypothetical protein
MALSVRQSDICVTSVLHYSVSASQGLKSKKAADQTHAQMRNGLNGGFA